MTAMNFRRARLLKAGIMGSGPVVYWMSRDQRTSENWALIFCQDIAIKNGLPLSVIFCLVPEFLGASRRHYSFMLEGLREVERKLDEMNINFFLLNGSPESEIPGFIDEHRASLLVADFSPLRISLNWKKEVAKQISIPFYEVDAHNIVPCWLSSNKQEYAARTFRPKIYRLLPEFLDEIPVLHRNSVCFEENSDNRWDAAEIYRTSTDEKRSAIRHIAPGEDAAKRRLRSFIQEKLSLYEKERNDPSKDGQSGLSPYLHFGHISAQRVALDVLASMKEPGSFLEELVVRKELSDNFCYYNSNYDSRLGFPDWSRKSLDEHQRDLREYIYTTEDLEKARTHDQLWNAAEREMTILGKMHGYMRMYWAKKILEWTESPAEALNAAIYLNDRYEIDGRDPNGYTSIAWSIGGVHDRAFKERPIFGKIRYMSYKGMRSKFDVQGYIEHVSRLEQISET
ncbi:MAG: Deoxyribodipyrimidine photo-lyase [Methanosaeta sp. PtaU1.Bin060]|nr:MAG: Deoxyribodipyrimidine photo-lyase [Methanosaeta sp. PtaU1.Bin060]